MGSLTDITIDFETSHLIFPALIACVLAMLGIAILIRDRRRLAAAGGYWRGVFQSMDRLRFFGTLGLTVLYFMLMVPVGELWPNTGLGFLLCSIPFVFLSALLFMHERPLRQVISAGIVAAAAPTFVWWLFTYPFFLTLP